MGEGVRREHFDVDTRHRAGLIRGGDVQICTLDVKGGLRQAGEVLLLAHAFVPAAPTAVIRK
jgi:hypothetical protein